jgi:hypothetical protein
MGVVCFEMSKVLARHGAQIDFVLPYTAHHPEAESFMNVIGATSRSPRQGGGFGAYDDWVNRSTEFREITDAYTQTALAQAKLAKAQAQLNKLKGSRQSGYESLSMKGGVSWKGGMFNRPVGFFKGVSN